jgi:choline dehydrogenase
MMASASARSLGRFDYVIVGAGSAGCVLANRLSACGRHKVLLIEAGPRDTNPWIHIPLGYGKLFRDASINWMYQTEPQPELNDRMIYQPRGKVLGGSSSINGLLYVRGQREDFDQWRQSGNIGWGWDDVLPYFIKAERQEMGAGAYHGGDGPLPVSNQRETHELCDAFIEASLQCGHGSNEDFNGASQEGAGYYQTTSLHGRRVSSAVAYLKPARHRPNLEVITKALVTRILLDGVTATGIEFIRNGKCERVEADGEVILAAGAINTPQLLQLSGIGPSDLLRNLGIKVQIESANVGENLQDHLQVRCIYRSTRPNTINDALGTLHGKLGVGLRYLLTRRGPLTLSAGYAGGFFRSEMSDERPDIQAHFITFSTDKMGDRLHDFSGFTVSSCQLRPESRGTVKIRSKDPREAPSIDPRYFTAPMDKMVNVAGLKLIRQIMRAPAFEDFVASEIEPGIDVENDEDILAFCRRYASTLYHPTCTARMGVDDGAVVDPSLKVKGARHLRIVDGSIMPALVSGNTHAGIVMIAEKAADMILEQAHPARRKKDLVA